MIEITNIEVIGFEPAIRGMRNPMNSWDKSDSEYKCPYNHPTCVGCRENFCVGENDINLMKRLFKAGTDHRKFMRMIVAYMDINAPLYWWKEFDTYKIGTVRNSCSTMHKIHTKEFMLSDFSLDNMDDISIKTFMSIIERLNLERKHFIQTNDKQHWWNIIQMLPSSYNQKATVMISYEALANMYFARKEHKQDEWREFCKIMLCKLPYFKDIVNDERLL